MARPVDTVSLDLFEIPTAPAPIGGSLDYTSELCHALADALKQTPLSRYQVAARMSELTGREITKAQLDAWTAESKEPWRFPFEYAAAFEAACETTCLQELLCRKRGSRVLVGRDNLLAEYGRVAQEKTRLAEREKQLRKLIGARR